MTRYIVGYVSLFDNELKMVSVEAENEFEALKAGIKKDHAWSETSFNATTVEELKSECFDADFIISFIAV